MNWKRVLNPCVRVNRAQRWLLMLFVILPVVAPALRKESVRSELTRLQKQDGLSFAWIYDGVKAVSFERRAIVPIEGTLDAFRPDGFSFQKYPEVSAIDMCWSHDRSMLAATMLDDPPNASLEVLDLRSKLKRLVAPRVGQRPHVTSQCWSPDDRQLVFEAEGSVRLYDLERGETSVVAEGMNPGWTLNPTWSSDGKRIAFLDFDSYYSVQPSGGNRKKLFTKKGACSGLYWSPDSLIVAYVSQAGMFESGFTLDAETYRLRVRRLEDDSEDWIANGVDCLSSYRWVTNKAIAAQVELATKSK